MQQQQDEFVVPIPTYKKMNKVGLQTKTALETLLALVNVPYDEYITKIKAEKVRNSYDNLC